MLRSGIRQLVASGALALCATGVILPVGEAAASDWGPLNSYYNGIERVSGYGSFVNDGNVDARTVYCLTDSRADGNTVYEGYSGVFAGGRCSAC